MTRDEVIKALEHELARANYVDSDWIDCIEVALLRDALALLKTEPKRGRWEGWTGVHWTGKFEENGDPEYKPCTVYHCSECGRTTIFREAFCPNCGALMRNEEISDENDGT